MRNYTLICASIVSVAGLALGACGKNEPPKTPESPLTQVSKPEAKPEKAETPPTPSKPDRDQELPAAADRKAPLDRSETIQATLASLEKGELGQAFKYFDKDVDWVEVGLPDGELEGVDQIVAYQQKIRTGFSDFHIKAKRIIEAADYQVVEYVWSAKHTGAFPDGTLATDKVATLPAALLIRYKENGLVDKVWSFQDWPNVLQQLGTAPGLPADFKAAAIPSKADVVIGAGVPEYRDRYVGFVSKLGPEDYKNTLAEKAATDFMWIDFGTGQPVKHDGSNTYLADRRGSFMRDSTDVETTIGAGPLFAAYVTNKLVYKGGFLGVPADNQKVTTHTLDIVEFDPANLRMKTLASYGNSYEILAALGLNAGAAQIPGLAVQGELKIGACDHYVADLSECMGSFETAMRDTTRATLDAQVTKWKSDLAAGAKLDDVENSCKAAAFAGKTSFGTQCPRTDWN